MSESTSSNGTGPETKHSRRKIIGWMVGIINLVVVGVVVGPVLGFVGAPLGDRRKGRWVPILDEGEIQDGETKEVTFEMEVTDGYMQTNRKYTVYAKRTGKDIQVFDPACTHLGCRIKFQNDKNRYFCPCHGGVFDDGGNVVSGPPPKPLSKYPVDIRDGKLWIKKEA